MAVLHAGNVRPVCLKLLHTSDVHGNYFTYDYVTNRPVRGGMSRVYAYVQACRRVMGGRVLLLDGGDVLQGSPLVYYGNNSGLGLGGLTVEVMNYMGYDVAVMGNHDIEMGSDVFDDWVTRSRFDVLGANVIDERTGAPYLKPYTVIERAGVRVAVLGLTTPVVPFWLSADLWRGLRFEEMVACARRWMEVIRGTEHPDVVVGLFHSGKEGGLVTPTCAENAALDVARQVAGFDLVCYGHDHRCNTEVVPGPDGCDVVCCAPSSLGCVLDEVDIEVYPGSGQRPKVSVRQVDVSYYKSAEVQYMHHYFRRATTNIKYLVGRRIGQVDEAISSEEAYFGPSAFVDLIHRAQLDCTGAQLSFAPPLSFSAVIGPGDVFVRDMFGLYSHEDKLYVMRLTGREIKGILEMSYGLWINTMKGPDDHVMLLDYVLDGGKRLGFKNLAYNFDSLAGLCYTVDVTCRPGGRISIQGMADGTPFSLDQWYTVAVNSYRGSGGGELFTLGGGIGQSELKDRIVTVMPHILRHYLTAYVERNGTIDTSPLGHWRLVPEEWAQPACARDRVLLFGRREPQPEKTAGQPGTGASQ